MQWKIPNTTPCRLCVHIYSFISLLHTQPRAHIPLCVYPQIYTEILLRKCRKIAYKNISYHIKVLSLINYACMWPHVVWEKQNRLFRLTSNTPAISLIVVIYFHNVFRCKGWEFAKVSITSWALCQFHWLKGNISHILLYTTGHIVRIFAFVMLNTKEYLSVCWGEHVCKKHKPVSFY